MTPEEKAKEICTKFALMKFQNGDVHYFIPTPLLKQCALICVDEILDFTDERKEGFKYWNEVKLKIEKL